MTSQTCRPLRWEYRKSLDGGAAMVTSSLPRASAAQTYIWRAIRSAISLIALIFSLSACDSYMIGRDAVGTSFKPLALLVSNREQTQLYQVKSSDGKVYTALHSIVFYEPAPHRPEFGSHGLLVLILDNHDGTYTLVLDKQILHAITHGAPTLVDLYIPYRFGPQKTAR